MTLETRLKGRLELLQQETHSAVALYGMYQAQLTDMLLRKRKLMVDLKTSSEALQLIKHVGVRTQKRTVFKIENLVTTAIRDVFGKDGYDFEMELTYTKRSLAVSFFFVRDKERYDPLECCGYGVVDVACFALRIAIWSLNPSRRVLILDEPFKNVSEEYRERVGQFVRKVSEQLNFQFIITTHMPELAMHAHRCFRLKKSGKKTTVTVEGNQE